MKLKKTWMSILACALAAVMMFALVACGPEASKDPVVKSIALDQTTATIATADTLRLTVKATYDDGKTEDLAASAEGLTWETSAEAVATVVRGIVTAKSAGTATITAKYGDLSATCAVTVYDLTVTISETTATIEKGETKTLTAKVLKNGEEQADEIEWTSSAPQIADVKDGVVTAYAEGQTKITAKRKDGNQSAACNVTVVWTNKPASYKEVKNGEENKGDPNTWHFWNDQGWNWTNSTVYEAYAEDYETGKTAAEGYEYIGANRMTISFEMEQPGVNEAAIQLIYRSSKVTEGKLEQNHDYALTCKVETNVGGLVFLNNYTGDGNAHEEENGIMLEAGKVNEITVEKFRHGDSGKKYANGIYDEVEAAIHMLLGNLEGRVTLSIYDLQYKDLGESAEKFEDDPEKLEGYVPQAELPDLSETPAIALDIASEDSKYEIEKVEDGKSYNVKYTGTVNNTYENIKVDIPETADAANCNTFEVTVKNNAETAMTIRFDINGEKPVGDNNVIDIVKSSLASKGRPNTDLTWGGTSLTIAGGDTVTLQLTYDANTERGKPTQILIYFDTVYATADDVHSGDVTISGFKFANVVDPTQLPEGATVTTTDVDLEADGETVYFVLKGTSTGVENAALEAYLKVNHFDLQQCGGSWKNYDALTRTVTVGENGAWEIKFDVTAMPVDAAAYTGHFGAKDPSDPTYKDNQWTDLKLESEHAEDGKSVTVSGKKYSISNKVDGTDESTNWGCVSLKVENADA